jgi:hypothetical protein
MDKLSHAKLSIPPPKLEGLGGARLVGNPLNGAQQHSNVVASYLTNIKCSALSTDKLRGDDRRAQQRPSRDHPRCEI